MIRDSYHSLLRLILLAVAVFLAIGNSTGLAFEPFASSLGSPFSLSSVERLVGPLFPGPASSSTFRSEFGASVAAAQVNSALLVGSRGTELDLREAMSLDEGPLRMEMYGKLRFWRFGLRAAYMNWANKTRIRNLGKIDFTGFNLAANFDLVQFKWLSFGASADYYLYDPRLQGIVFTTDGPITLDVKGDRPLCVGAYARYVPPAILGYPVHIEAFYKVPVHRAKYTTYGLHLVYRPQLYRFDAACRVIVEKAHLKFASDPLAQDNSFQRVPLQNWEVSMEWALVGIELLAYF